MGFDTMRVDAPSFEKLIDAIINGDLEGGQAAIGEMALAHRGDSDVARIIQVARKRGRGIVDGERPPMVLPVLGLRVGSTLAIPRHLPSDPVAGCMASAADAEAPIERVTAA